MDGQARQAPFGGERAAAAKRRARGFTLLEVMVSVAILGLGLTAILSAQAGAFSSAAHARNLSVATGLARCKMSELEEQISRDGLPALDENDSGACCEGDESPMRCAWKIEKPELPEPKFGELNLDTQLDSSQLKLDDATKGASSLGSDAKLGDVAQSLLGGQSGSEGAGGGAAAGGMDGMFGMVMEMVYPDVKSLFEASARRLTVKLSWKEGNRDHEIELVQWVTVPQMGAPPPDEGEGGASGSTSSSASTGTGGPLQNGPPKLPGGRK